MIAAINYHVCSFLSVTLCYAHSFSLGDIQRKLQQHAAGRRQWVHAHSPLSSQRFLLLHIINFAINININININFNININIKININININNNTNIKIDIGTILTSR